MRVLIYGGGAVGLGLASCLAEAGAEIHILARGETARALRGRGLERTGIFGERRAAPDRLSVCETLDAIPPSLAFDFVLVCTKSFDSAAAARDLAGHPTALARDGAIVLFQNGWGNDEIFADALPEAAIYNARVITGFARSEPHRVEITVHGDAVRVGALGAAPLEAVAPLCRAIAAGGLPCEPTPEIGKYLWAKLLYNCALNPLGAILAVPYGRLAEWPETRAIMDEVHAEAWAAMEAAGYGVHRPTLAAFREAFYGEMLPPTAAHESSMLQDIRAGKPTEIDALNGAVVALARRRGLPAPVNATLRGMIRAMEGRRRTGFV